VTSGEGEEEPRPPELAATQRKRERVLEVGEEDDRHPIVEQTNR